jgi:hypothetical protein
MEEYKMIFEVGYYALTSIASVAVLFIAVMIAIDVRSQSKRYDI